MTTARVLIIEEGIHGTDYSPLVRAGIPFDTLDVWWLGRWVELSTAQLRTEIARRRPACVIAAGNEIAACLLGERYFNDPLSFLAPRARPLRCPDGIVIPMVVSGPFTKANVEDHGYLFMKALALVRSYLDQAPSGAVPQSQG